jgi:hypothetical protein
LAFADDSGISNKYPAGSPEWRSVLQQRIGQLNQARSALLTAKNGESYADAELRYKRAESLQNRINKLSAMLADNSESVTGSARKPAQTAETVSDQATVDFSYLSNPVKPRATARPITNTGQ